MEAIGPFLDRARQGDGEALSALYQQFLPGIFGYVAMRVPDRATAEDLTSEVFLQMVAGIHNLKANDAAGFTAWLLRIARVAVAGYYRKRTQQPALLPLPGESWEEMQIEQQGILQDHLVGDPAFTLEAREDWLAVVQAINLLTEEQRQVLVARIILGYDLATTARVIGKKTNAVKALQFRALKSLQRLLDEPQEHKEEKEEIR
jgi:RNA polymerase sigma-70 factor (ECF subfamily)